MRERPSSSNIRLICSGGASTGSATTRLRGTITSPAVSSRKARAREAISAVGGSSEPAFPASSTSCSSSSAERRASVKVVRSPKGRSTRFEVLVRSQTSGRASWESHRSGFPTTSAYRSALRSASDFGTSSPRTSDRYDTSATTSAKAMLPAQGARGGKAATAGSMRRESWAPPRAAAVAPTTVMPVWTVAMSRSGAFRSSSTARAPGRRCSTSWWMRLRRNAMSAISAPAKMPLAKIRRQDHGQLGQRLAHGQSALRARVGTPDCPPGDLPQNRGAAARPFPNR